MKVDTWAGCYPSSWKGLIVPDAIAHPAKYSSKLIRRIYDHLAEEGWVTKGDEVVDPFGGVALGAFDAMRRGLRWRGVELEPRFAVYGNQNIDLWNERFGKMPIWGEAALLCGDSRELVKVLADHKYFKVAVSSPPYADGSQHTGGDDKHPEHIRGGTYYGVGISASVSSPPYSDMAIEKNAKSIDLEKLYKVYKKSGGGQTYEAFCKTQSKHSVGYSALISSPPYADSIDAGKGGIDWGKAGRPDRLTTDAKGIQGANGREEKYGSESGQLGSMKSTEQGFSAAISSPPFTGSTADGGWQMLGKYAEEGKLTVKQVKGKKNKSYPSWDKDRDTAYAPSAENLGNLDGTEAGFAAAISSPPFQGNSGGKNVTAKEGVLADAALLHRHAAGNSQAGYGDAEGNLGSLVPTEKGFEAAVSSPPFENQNACSDLNFSSGRTNGGGKLYGDYGKSDGQIGNVSGDDFWFSARTIVEQVYQVLAPGAHAVWVVKDYVKGGKIVPFVDQWRQLCEAVGFETLHEHHAMLVHSRQSKLEGGEHVRESKSFFRRLAEKKGSPRIDYEVVLCMVKLP